MLSNNYSGTRALRMVSMLLIILESHADYSQREDGISNPAVKGVVTELPGQRVVRPGEFILNQKYLIANFNTQASYSLARMVIQFHSVHPGRWREASSPSVSLASSCLSSTIS